MEGVQDVAPAVKVALKGLAFRCYRPMDEKLLSLARSELQTQSPWEGWVQQLKLEDAQLAAAPTEEKVTFVPRKPNWDLKRDAAPKVERLERATQRAVADIVRKKIAAAASGQAPAASAAVVQVRASAVGVGSAAGAGGLDEVATGMDGAALARAVEGGARGGEEEEGEGPRGGSKRPRRRRYDSDDEEG